MDFFSALRKRVETQTTAEFDRNFWTAFDREFKGERRSERKFFFVFEDFKQFALACSLVLVVVSLGSLSRSFWKNRTADSESELATHAEFLDHLELVETLPDPNMNDEEWSILLSQN